MSNRDLIRLVHQDTIMSALRHDADVLATSEEGKRKYIEANVINYDLAINTWLLAIRDFAPQIWPTVAIRIQKEGLADTVSYFKTAADWFVDDPQRFYSDTSDPHLAKGLYRAIETTVAHPLLTSVYNTTNTISGIFLFLCRYLKRFTPLHAQKLDDTAVADFISNQKRLKLLCRQEYNPLIISLCREEINGLYRKSIITRGRQYSSIKMFEIELTPGVCYSLDGKKLRTRQDKEDDLIKEYRYNTREVLLSPVWNYLLGDEAYLTTVPKSFSAARTIAPEQVLRQSVAHRMFSLRGDTPEGIDLQDQSRNQELALAGSRTGSWATIDLSHASDDVTWVLVQDIFSEYPVYLRYLAQIRPRYVHVPSKDKTTRRVLLQSFATMGNSMTFLVESEVFWIITKAAVHFAQRMGEDLGEAGDTVVVYGDDIVCTSAAVPYVIAFLEKLGFSPNVSKTYYTGMFRESCGKDYLAGEDVSSPYFPRKGLQTLLQWYRTKDSQLITVAESLISLQHRLMDVSPTAAQYIELYIKENKPKLGYMYIGTQSTDLWGFDNVYYCIRHPKTGEFVEKVTKPWLPPRKQRKLVRVLPDPGQSFDINCQLRPCVKVNKGQRDADLVYLEYLEQGPWYATDIDRMLGISTSRFNIPVGAPVSSWDIVEC